MDSEQRGHSASLIFFTDGACSGNPGPGGWGVVGADLEKNLVFEFGGSHPATTNNLMELEAASQALEFCLLQKNDLSIEIFADSKYVLTGITAWVHNWKKNRWIKSDGKSVLNQTEWERLDNLLTALGRSRVRWSYVAGHAGIPGNERVDEIAVLFSKGDPAELYRGSLKDYPVDLFQVSSEDLSEKKNAKEGAPKKKLKKIGKAFYLSLVQGKVERHETWAECESRVKGQSGAKFKKIESPAEESETLAGWGVKS